MKIRKKVCEECGEILSYNSKDNGHDPSCSQFEHFGDDSPYSACSNGRCAYCTPNSIKLRPKTTQEWVNSKQGLPKKGEVIILQHESEEAMPTIEIVNPSTLLRLKCNQGLWWTYYKKFKSS